MRALSVCQQVSAAADDQLLFLSDWKLAITSLPEVLDSVVSSLQGRPRELAGAVAAKFVASVQRALPQQDPQALLDMPHPQHPSGLRRHRGPRPWPR